MTTMENNKWFPKAEYQKRMSQIGKVVSIVTSADKLGFPCARERLFSTTLSYEALIWVGPSTDEEIYHDLHALFGRRCQVEADVYVCDSQENACVYRRELARTRGIFGGSVDQLVQLLPPDGRHRLLSYEQMKDRLIGMKGTGVVDISQNPKKRPRGGAWLPTCQRKSQFVSMSSTGAFSDYHVFTPREIGISQGWPMIPLGNTQSFVDVLNPALLECKSGRELLVGLGNGVHLTTLTAWNLYIVSNCVRRQAIEFLAPPLQLAHDVGADADLCNDEEGIQPSSSVL